MTCQAEFANVLQLETNNGKVELHHPVSEVGLTMIATMPRKVEKSESARGTASVQIDRDLARMVAVIASHRRVSQASIISPVLRDFIEAQYAIVSREIQEEVKHRTPRAGR